MSRQIIVSEKKIPLSHIDINGKRVPSGTMRTFQYEGDSVYRHDYLNTTDTEPKILKASKKQEKVLNHSDAQKLLIDNGYKPLKLQVMKNGIRIHGIYTPTRGGLKLEDPFIWDVTTWGGPRNPNYKKPLVECIILQSNATPGRGVTYERGFYRFICTNGIVDRAMNLGRFHRNADNFDAGELARELFGTPVKLSERQLLGETIGSPVGAKHFATAINNYLEAEHSEEFINSQPAFVRDMMKPWERVPGWYLHEVKEQFNTLANNVKRKDIHRGDVINVLTNAINHGLQENDTRSAEVPQRKLQTMINKSSDMIGAFSLIHK